MNLPTAEEAMAEALEFQKKLEGQPGPVVLASLLQYSREAMAASLIAQMSPAGRHIFLARMRDFFPEGTTQ